MKFFPENYPEEYIHGEVEFFGKKFRKKQKKIGLQNIFLVRIL